MNTCYNKHVMLLFFLSNRLFSCLYVRSFFKVNKYDFCFLSDDMWGSFLIINFQLLCLTFFIFYLVNNSGPQPAVQISLPILKQQRRCNNSRKCNNSSRCNCSNKCNNISRCNSSNSTCLWCKMPVSLLPIWRQMNYGIFVMKYCKKKMKKLVLQIKMYHDI